ISWVGPLVNLAYTSTRLGDYPTATSCLVECLELVWDLGERRAGVRAQGAQDPSPDACGGLRKCERAARMAAAETAFARANPRR
ncbi:MAG: hypothetical protein D6815_04240, partial [Candidatus Dadabacteria bacterium]